MPSAMSFVMILLGRSHVYTLVLNPPAHVQRQTECKCPLKFSVPGSVPECTSASLFVVTLTSLQRFPRFFENQMCNLICFFQPCRKASKYFVRISFLFFCLHEGLPSCHKGPLRSQTSDVIFYFPQSVICVYF